MRTILILAILAIAPLAAAEPREDATDDDDDWEPIKLPANMPVAACGRCASDAPTVAQVITAAYAAGGLDGSPSASWIRRARWSALIPLVSVRAGRTETWQDPEPDVRHNLTYEVRATWRLDRLAFDGRELQVASVDAARRRERRRLATRVIRVYFAWLRASRAAAIAPDDPRFGLAAAEAAAELDALTDGRFTPASPPP